MGNDGTKKDSDRVDGGVVVRGLKMTMLKYAWVGTEEEGPTETTVESRWVLKRTLTPHNDSRNTRNRTSSNNNSRRSNSNRSSSSDNNNDNNNNNNNNILFV